MTRFTKTLLTAMIFSLSASSAIVTEAGCHGRSGGYSGGGYSGRYHSGVSSYHLHNAYHYRQPVYAQPPQPVVYSEPVIQPAPQTQYLTQPQQQALQQQMIPQQTATPLQPQIQPPVEGGNSAELSALQALGAFAPPQAAGQQTPQTATDAIPISQSLVGTWTARLSNGATVLLNLQADGSFNWTATNASGSTTTFQGQYVVDNESLVLNRSSDNQRLTGNAAMTGNQTFSFRMSNSNAASLEFHRS